MKKVFLAIYWILSFVLVFFIFKGITAHAFSGYIDNDYELYLSDLLEYSSFCLSEVTNDCVTTGGWGLSGNGATTTSLYADLQGAEYSSIVPPDGSHVFLLMCVDAGICATPDAIVTRVSLTKVTPGVWTLDDYYEIAPESTATRIISINPADDSTIDNPVNFQLHAYLDPADLEGILGIKITLHNIDQNIIAFQFLSPDDIYLFEGQATSSGHFYYSTSTDLSYGNYRIEACLFRTYFGFIGNPFANLIEGEQDCQSHQFVVGESTFIGKISQSIFSDTNDFYEGLTATSSEALASSCNPLSSNFEIRECVAFMFIPDASNIKDFVDNMREGVLTHVPWGYATRLYDIFAGPATSSLPSYTVSIPGGGGSGSIEYETLTFDMQDMVAGGGALLDSVEDPVHSASLRDIFEDIIKAIVAMSVVFTIAIDILKSHSHPAHLSRRQTVKQQSI